MDGAPAQYLVAGSIAFSLRESLLRRNRLVLHTYVGREGGPKPRSGEQFGGVLGEVGDDEVCAGAANAEERFERGAVAVEPAFFKCGLEHGVLAGDLVSADGHADALAGRTDYIEVGQELQGGSRPGVLS